MGVLALAVFVSLGLAPLRWTSTSYGLAALVAGAAVVSGLVIAAVAAVMADLG